MAAFSAARATNRRKDRGGDDGSVVDQTARRRREGSGGGSGGSEAAESRNLDMAPATILEFFQMCDIENKGFITQRDMQVRLLQSWGLQLRN